MKTFKYTQENEKEFQRLLKKYPNSDAMMLPGLWLVQEQEGWVSPEAMVFMANRLGKTPIEVYSFASFYTMFNLKPIGTYHIELCKTLSCMLMGAPQLKKFIKDTLIFKSAFLENKTLRECQYFPFMKMKDAE